MADRSADSGFGALATPSLRSPIAADTFYFVMTDRYRDGDPANNTGGQVGPLATTGFDPSSNAYYHGGDLAGFALLRGDPEKLARVNTSPEFARITMRAQTCLDNVGVVHAYVDDGVMRVMGAWREAIADLV